MRTSILIAAGVGALLGAAQPAQAQFYRWGPYPRYRPFYGTYAYPYYGPFYPPRVVYAVPPPYWYEPPPVIYAPPPIYERRSSERRPRITHRPAQRASAPPAPKPSAPAPSHDLYPPESY